VEVIRQAVKRGEKVLASAPSNIAVDNLVERLSAFGARVVRLGHPARLLPSVLEHSLDALVEKSEGARIALAVHRELESLRRRLRKATNRADRRAWRDELRRLRAEARALEEKAVRDLLSSAEVVLSTNTGAGDPLLLGLEFDLVLIDEAAQSLEASSWISLLKGRRAVLAGDHRQLPPTIKSREAERRGLGLTLFDRLSSLRGEAVTRMLATQYRMHEAIMEWPSRELYGGRLTAHASVANHLLSTLPHVEGCPLTQMPLLFIDTAGCDLEETAPSPLAPTGAMEGDSKANAGEAEIVVKHVQALFEKGLSPSEVAVITPYNAQVDLLRARLGAAHPELEIGSVDGFQGREKEAVVISLVRSNARGEVGFLADDRRTNVAITRARRHLAIVGDSATLSAHPFLRRLVQHCAEKGEYRSGWEYR
jgi:ATP-dependent RNA/DNA helicase IGHMBP2